MEEQIPLVIDTKDAKKKRPKKEKVAKKPSKSKGSPVAAIVERGQYTTLAWNMSLMDDHIGKRLYHAYLMAGNVFNICWEYLSIE